MPKAKLSLLKKGILDEFLSDFLTLPWKVRKELLDPIYELYEDDPDITQRDIYSALFYMTYGFDPAVKVTPIADVFKMFKIYRDKWIMVDLAYV
jgi:hypothetical protein